MLLLLRQLGGLAFQEQAGDECFDGVVALIGLAGAWVGAGRISCSAEFARRVSGALLSAEYEAVNEDVSEDVGSDFEAEDLAANLAPLIGSGADDTLLMDPEAPEDES